MDRNTKAIIVLAGLSFVAAVGQQLMLPPQERTWQGHIAGIPYDLRPPTLERLKARLWNPDNPSLLAPHIFGVGWSINFYRLLHPLER